MTIRFGISSAALLALAACGGGAAEIDLGAGPGTYDDLVTENARFLSLIPSPDATDFTSGDVNYDGIILLGEDLSTADGNPTDPDGYIGQVDLDANVTTGVVNGTASNFFSTGIDAGGSPVGPSAVVASSGWALTSGGRTGNEFELAVTGIVDGRNVNGVIDMEYKNSPVLAGPIDSMVGVSDPLDPLDVTGAEITTFDAFLGATD